MKKITIFCLSMLAVAFSLTSCNKDDNSGSGDAAGIQGKWTYHKEGGMFEGEEILMAYEGNEEGCAKDYITIGATSFVETDYDSFDAPCEVFTYEASYVKSGNTLSVTWPDEETPETFEIVTLTNSELKIKNASGYVLVFVR